MPRPVSNRGSSPVPGGDHRGAVRPDVQHGRTRSTVHRAEGAAVACQAFLGDPHRLYGVDQGLRLLLGVQRSKGRSALVRPDSILRVGFTAHRQTYIYTLAMIAGFA